MSEKVLLCCYKLAAFQCTHALALQSVLATRGHCEHSFPKHSNLHKYYKLEDCAASQRSHWLLSAHHLTKTQTQYQRTPCQIMSVK